MVIVESNLYIARKNENVKFPTKREEDGCYDLYAYLEDGAIDIAPGEIKLVPTGIYTALTPHHRISIRERSSNTKWGGLVVGGQIDSGYRGEIFVAIYNSHHHRWIRIGCDGAKIFEAAIPNGAENTPTSYVFVPISKAIAQFAVESVPLMNTVELTVDELMEIPSERGTGALGSSKK